MLVSVVVCTFNRADLLDGCLLSLLQQSADMRNYEILIVDNNSTDRTPQIGAAYASRHENVRYIREERQGLSIARNRGFREAAGEYVAYIDDDAKADTKWVECIREFAEQRPEVEVFGGPFSGFTVDPPPLWYKASYGSWSLGNTERAIGMHEWLSGNNIVFKKNTLKRLGGFDTRLGMMGTMTYYGEETNLQHILKMEGREIYFVPGIAIRHLVAGYKLNIVWMLKSAYMNGRAGFLTFSYKRTVLRQLFRVLFFFMRGMVSFVLSGDRYLQSRLYESFYPFLWHLGLTVGMLRT